jgi:predicted transport protein
MYLKFHVNINFVCVSVQETEYQLSVSVCRCIFMHV